MQRERRLTLMSETPEAPTKKLVCSLPDGPDVGAQLGRIETILDSILRNLAPLVGAR